MLRIEGICDWSHEFTAAVQCGQSDHRGARGAGTPMEIMDKKSPQCSYCNEGDGGWLLLLEDHQSRELPPRLMCIRAL